MRKKNYNKRNIIHSETKIKMIKSRFIKKLGANMALSKQNST